MKPAMKLTALIATTAIATSLAATTHAGKYDNRQSHRDYAKVVEVEPIYKTITHRVPVQSCWVETVQEPVRHSARTATPALLGALIGGALGNELGHKKSNKRVGAAAGAILGASIGNDIGRRHSGHTETYTYDQEVCDTDYSTEYEEKLVGYDVSYQYHGRTYSTRMNEHPGKKIPVAVDIRPIRF